MTLNVEEEAGFDFDFDWRKLAEEVLETALQTESFPFEAEVSLLLVTAEDIQEINREHRGIDAPTDVLSFPLISYPSPGEFGEVETDEDNFNPDTGEALLGDIVLCIDKVKEQARNFGHSEKREYAFLILHSILHLLGYDHITQQESELMEDKQNKILGQMGILR